MFIYHQENANYFENSTFSLLEDYCSHHVPMIAQMFPPLDCWFNPPSKILYRKLHYGIVYIYTYTHTYNQIYTYTYYIYMYVRKKYIETKNKDGKNVEIWGAPEERRSVGFAVQASASTVTGTSMGTYPSKLVGGIPTQYPSEKYEWEGWQPIYYGELKMIETTNQ